MKRLLNQKILANASAMFNAMSHKDLFLIDLSGVDLETIVLAMYCAIWMGRGEPEILFQYLESTVAIIRRETFDLILDAFDGTDPFSDLWLSDKYGNYVALVGACPLYWREDERSKLPEPRRRAALPA